MHRNYLFAVISKCWSYSFQEMHFKLFFVHVYKCEARNRGAQRFVHRSGEFIDKSSDAKSSEACCIAQSAVTEFDCSYFCTQRI